jgi:deoxyribonuclease-4
MRRPVASEWRSSIPTIPRPLGSRCSRHTHIGRGVIGRRPFGWILADPRFKNLPKVIETPKENDMDPVNLRVLGRLARDARPLA